MYAVEFDTISKDGFIYIPQEYKDELDNREDIRLVVMYDTVSSKENKTNVITDEIRDLEKLFLNSNNQVIAKKNNIVDTNEMIDDIS